MPVILTTSKHIPPQDRFPWVAIGACGSLSLDPALHLPDVAVDLDRAFDSSTETWLGLARQLGEDTAAHPNLAHTPACAPNASDFGVMLAWTKLIENWARRTDTIMAICDDPWLFRHLALLPFVHARMAPSLWPRELLLNLRGFLVRTVVAVRAIVALSMLRGQQKAYPDAAPAILAYGHPSSMAAGHDGYFGDLMAKIPELRRVLHVDCPPRRARVLCAGGRTVSLHAWGNLYSAARLPFARWRPRVTYQLREVEWLIRRASMLEGGTGQAAMIRWQQICQAGWLRAKRPSAVTWPWENHAWERRFVTDARAAGVRTLGYQHTPFGRQDLSFHPGSNAAGDQNTPDRILASGPACAEALIGMGYSAQRVTVVGSLRFSTFSPPAFDPAGPVLFALPYHLAAAPQMIQTASRLADEGWSVLVKPHPMMSARFVSISPKIRTDVPFPAQPPLSAVVFAASSIGLEALAGAIPVIRFLPDGDLALDPLPPDVVVPAADGQKLVSLLKDTKVVRCDPKRYYAPVDFGAWRQILLSS